MSPYLLTPTCPKRETLKSYLRESHEIYESLFALLKNQTAYTTLADPLRHPLIFYYGHTSVFYVNKLVAAKLIERVHPELERLFEVGVDEMNWDELDMPKQNWPHYQAVREYRQEVLQMLESLIDQLPEEPLTPQSANWIILMGIEHERIHIETSSVLIRQLPLALIHAGASPWPLAPQDTSAATNFLLPVQGGKLNLGVSPKKQPKYYHWDNEFGEKQVRVDPFQAAAYLTSNEEYKEFVDSGGYEDPRWWTFEGQGWLATLKKNHPPFWKQSAGKWGLRLIDRVIDLPPSWPAEVNYLESKAFCNWKAASNQKNTRLPTEEEWYALLAEVGLLEDVEQAMDMGNLNLKYGSPSPVSQHMFGKFGDLLGNVWQHTETPIAPFKGFKPHPLYQDFSTPTFDNKHNLIKGGSFISTGNELLLSSRLAFRRHFYQHASFRYIVSDKPEPKHGSSRETDQAYLKLCEAHFGDALENLHYQLADFARKQVRLNRTAREKALVLNCQIGRACFELSTLFKNVIGTEPTADILRLAVDFQQQGQVNWQDSEDEKRTKSAKLENYHFANFVRNIRFLQANPRNMPARHTGYQLLIAYNPELEFLAGAHQHLAQGGLLIFTHENPEAPKAFQETLKVRFARLDTASLEAKGKETYATCFFRLES